MKFKITKKELEKALSIVDVSLSQKTVIDSLRGIKISTGDNYISFTSSKQDVATKYTVTQNIEIMEQGTAILPGSFFLTVIKKTKEENFTISSEQNKTIIQTIKTKTELMEFPEDTYPSINFSFSTDSAIDISSITFMEAFKKTNHSVALQNNKPIITGLNFKVENNILKVSTTDARRLSILTFEVDGEDCNFTIQKNIVGELVKIFEINKEEKIRFLTNGNQLIIDNENLKIRTKLLEGDYPKLEKLVPQGDNFSIVINSEMLNNTLDKIISLSNRENSNVTIFITNGQLELKSIFKEIGGIEELCEIGETTGTPMKISIDPRFLLEAVKSISKEEVKLTFLDELSPFLIKGIENEKNIQVVSPIRMT